MNSCNSECGCLDRRQFLKLTAAAAFTSAIQSPFTAIAGPFEPADTDDHFVPADKKLHADWLKGLTAKGTPEWFAGSDLKLIGMPVGGICAGQLYLAGDGRLVHWDIFNETSEAGRARTNYQVYPEPIASIQQGFVVEVKVDGQIVRRSLDATGFPEVRFRGEYPIGKVEYASSDFPLAITMEAFSPFIPLNSDDSSLPATVLQFKVKNRGPKMAEVVLAGCLENAVSELTQASFGGKRRNELSRQRGRALVTSSAVSVPVAKRETRPAVVLADFEQENYGDWTVEGTAFGDKPATGTLPRQQKVEGFEGKGLVNTFLGGDDAKGKLTSPTFKIERDFINFLIGGGRHAKRTCINLLVDSKITLTARGEDNERLVWQSWDVRHLAGKQARIEIVDQQTGGWGHINIDHIEQSDVPRRKYQGALEDQADFGTMCLGLAGEKSDVIGTADLGGIGLDQWMGALSKAGANSSEQPFGNRLIGALGKRLKLKAGADQTVTFVIAWHFAKRPEHGNYYGRKFRDASAAANYILDNIDRLAGQTRLWHATWYDSTLPWWLLDRLFSPVSILASATCQRWANGRFWAWEGVRCCAGTCAHVWNYAHSLARLFPDLERTIREMQDFDKGFVEGTGAINFRGESNDFWAGDSQGGTALKCLREHQMSRDSEFLKRNWPRIRKSVEFLINQDGNNDGLIEGQQHNTYDINFFGANTMVGSLYLGALWTAEEMAKEVGDIEFARKCREIFEAGSKLTVEHLFNGEYFIQTVDLQKHPKHQYADGCLADQLFGQGWAHQVGLGYLYPPDNVRSALKAIWTYNWAPDIGPQNKAHPPQRWFARPGEAGLFTCTWPKSKHLGPESVLYRDEIWTGIEYQVAGHMAWEGMIPEALAICRAVHERYHPAKQNPWNEVECGDHYARAMASHGVFLGLCGFHCHGPKGVIGFAPRLQPERFKAAFTTADAWGTFSQTIEKQQLSAEIRPKWGTLRTTKISLDVPKGARVAKASMALNGKEVPITFEQRGNTVLVKIANEVLVNAEGKAEVSLGWA